MRVRSPSVPAWVIKMIIALWLIIAAPVVMLGAALFGAVWLKRRAIGPRGRWSPWFAWYPVRVWDADIRWLETVERRSGGLLADTHFRAVDREAS